MKAVVLGNMTRRQAETLKRLGFHVLNGPAKLDLDNSIVVVVDDRPLAERLGALYMSREELEEFLRFAEPELRVPD
jgi:predicted ATP-grasp superfamily ATP-dependent carboligase